MSTAPERAPCEPGASVRHLWRTRLTQAVFDSYAGGPLAKLPEDLRVYEDLLGDGRVVRTGGAHARRSR